MNERLHFSRVGSRLNINGELHAHLEFVDICAAFGERLRAWKEAALKDGMDEKRVRASMAIDITPRDDDVHQMDVVTFLKMLPAKSVVRMNGDYINVRGSGRKRDDSTNLLMIASDIRRVLTPKGELHLTMPLYLHERIVETMRNVRMKIEPVAFGYVGFLGGRNARGFPSEGLPPVEPKSYFIRKALEDTRYAEEEDPFGQLCAELIGTYGYSDKNPIRYRAVPLKKRRSRR